MVCLRGIAEGDDVSDWKAIDTAPRDGTIVDLAMIDHEGRQWREANAHYHIREGTFFVDGQIIKQIGEWWAPNHDYDGEDGNCEYQWDEGRKFKRATHWMPPPDLPKIGDK